MGQESQASSCLRKGTPLASRVAQGVSGPMVLYVEPAGLCGRCKGLQCPFVLCLHPQTKSCVATLSDNRATEWVSSGQSWGRESHLYLNRPRFQLILRNPERRSSVCREHSLLPRCSSGELAEDSPRFQRMLWKDGAALTNCLFLGHHQTLPVFHALLFVPQRRGASP